MALHLPQLPLQIFCRGVKQQAPLAVSEVSGGRKKVLACNRVAFARGIRPGMTVPAACALLAELELRPRHVTVERETLEHMAGWAGQFSSLVSLAATDCIVLEVAGSLRLFGGLKELLVRVRAGLEELGYAARLAVAPTPLGATLLARNGVEESVSDAQRLLSRLAPLPMQSLGLDAAVLEKLQGLGLRCIGDCLRLPRDGLARRFGPGFVLDLDRALGRAPDPRAPFISPPRFEGRLLLPAQTEDCQALLFAVHRLLLELTGFLKARDGGVQELFIEMGHYDRLPTRVTLKLMTPSRDPRHLQELLRVRLEDFSLPEPVQDIRLVAGKILPLPDQDSDLFNERESQEAGWLLLEHLRARLGHDAVRGSCLVPEHRPERAFHACAPGDSGPRPTFGTRPLWLLAEPQHLKAVDGRPWLQGELRLCTGPERIESGWWDGQDAARDYFEAENPKGSHFWIFREREGKRRWFLHGLFA
ncbi:MAG: DNA polymerase Y family protein [Gammaproteobacteria bacterium]|nr:MAG: DNA polymerase Y family protein [Gammaproteobacteria bacterium]